MSTPGSTMKARINQLKSDYTIKKRELDNRNTPYNKAEFEQAKYNLDEAIRSVTGGYNSEDLIEMRKKNVQILSNLKKRNLVEDNKNTDGSTTTDTTGEQIGGVTERASQPRSIVINIDALNKGGINTSQTTLGKMTPEEIEKWFTEAMMRVMRGVELSYE